MSDRRCKVCGDELTPERFGPFDSSNMWHNLQVRCRSCVLGIDPVVTHLADTAVTEEEVDRCSSHSMSG